MADTNEGANVGRDVSTGGDYVGRDKSNVAGFGSGGSSRVDVHNELPLPLITVSGDNNRILSELKIALLGDPYNRRGNPGIVEIVEETRDKISSLVAANAVQSLRLDNVDGEMKLLSDSQKSSIDVQSRFQMDSEIRFKIMNSSQDNARILIWLIAVFLIGEGAYLVYLSLKISGL